MIGRTVENTDKYVIIDKVFFDSAKGYLKIFKHRALTIYSIIMRGYNFRQETRFTTGFIKNMLNISDNNHTAQKYVLEALKLFESNDLFKYITPIDTNNLIIANVGIIDKYVCLYDFEIDTILESTLVLDKDKLLSVFLYIKSCINHKSKVAYPSIDNIQEHTFIKSRKSIITYIKALYDLGLILIGNIGVKVYDGGVVRESGNVYTMNYEGNDKVLKKYLEQERKKSENKRIKIIKHNNANAKRSAKMKKIWEERKKTKNFISK